MAGQARSTSSFVDAGTHRRNVKAARLKVNRWAIEYFVPATRPRLENFGTMKEKLQRISNMLLSLCAGFASFAFPPVAVLMTRDLRSAERRGGEGCVSMCRTRWLLYN